MHRSVKRTATALDDDDFFAIACCEDSNEYLLWPLYCPPLYCPPLRAALQVVLDGAADVARIALGAVIQSRPHRLGLGLLGIQVGLQAVFVDVFDGRPGLPIWVTGLASFNKSYRPVTVSMARPPTPPTLPALFLRLLQG